MDSIGLFSLGLDVTALVLTVIYLIRIALPSVKDYFGDVESNEQLKRSLWDQRIRRRRFA